jgi:hypothetical protein
MDTSSIKKVDMIVDNMSEEERKRRTEAKRKK